MAKGLPIVALSALPGQEERNMGFDMGFDKALIPLYIG